MTSEAKLGPKSKSILIQVAFKGAIEVLATKDSPVKLDDVKAGTEALYNMLYNLHEELGAGDEPNRGGGGGFRGKSSGGGGGNSDYQPPKVAKEDKPVVALDFFGNGSTIQFVDNRPFKGEGKPYKSTAADFQSVNKLDIGDGKGERTQSLWLRFPDGEPNEDVQAMVAKAEGGGSANELPDEAPF